MCPKLIGSYLGKKKYWTFILFLFFKVGVLKNMSTKELANSIFTGDKCCYIVSYTMLTLNVNAFTHFLRASIGCLHPILVHFSAIVRRSTSYLMAILFIEIITFKALQLVIHKRIAALNDDIISVFMLCVDLCMVSIWVFVWIWMGSLDNSYTNLLSCTNTPPEYLPQPNK